MTHIIFQLCHATTKGIYHLQLSTKLIQLLAGLCIQGVCSYTVTNHVSLPAFAASSTLKRCHRRQKTEMLQHIP